MHEERWLLGHLLWRWQFQRFFFICRVFNLWLLSPTWRLWWHSRCPALGLPSSDWPIGQVCYRYPQLKSCNRYFKWALRIWREVTNPSYSCCTAVSGGRQLPAVPCQQLVPAGGTRAVLCLAHGALRSGTASVIFSTRCFIFQCWFKE